MVLKIIIITRFCKRFVMFKKFVHVVMTTQEFMTEVTEAAGWSESTLKNMGKTYEALYCAVSEGWKGRGREGNYSRMQTVGVLLLCPQFSTSTF